MKLGHGDAGPVPRIGSGCGRPARAGLSPSLPDVLCACTGAEHMLSSPTAFWVGPGASPGCYHRVCPESHASRPPAACGTSFVPSPEATPGSERAGAAKGCTGISVKAQ